MRLSNTLVPVAGLIASVQANPVYGTGVIGTSVQPTGVSTVVVTEFTTVCPSPTTFAYHNSTYTVTGSTTLTITACPCTLTVSTPPPVTTTSTFLPPPPAYNGTTPATLYPNSTAAQQPSTTVIVSQPPPSTYLSGTTPITGGQTITTAPTNTPVGPTSVPTGVTPPVTVNAAGKLGSSIGALVVAVTFFAFAL